MDKKVISELLEKYFDGSSSLQEEETLKRAFSEDESLIKDFPEGAVFYYLKAEEKVKGNVDLPDLKVRSFWSASSYRWAATLLLGIGLSWGMWSYNQYQQFDNPVEIQDPELAMIEAKKALALVSKKLNHGKTQVAQPVRKYKEVTPVLIP